VLVELSGSVANPNKRGTYIEPSQHSFHRDKRLIYYLRERNDDGDGESLNVFNSDRIVYTSLLVGSIGFISYFLFLISFVDTKHKKEERLC